jgi:hypothetical protein
LSLFQNPKSPWGARGWSQFCEAKLLLGDCGAIPWARGAQGIAAEILLALAKRLERKARFAAFYAANAPKFRIGVKL